MWNSWEGFGVRTAAILDLDSAEKVKKILASSPTRDILKVLFWVSHVAGLGRRTNRRPDGTIVGVSDSWDKSTPACYLKGREL